MNSEELTTGGISATPKVRKDFALESKAFNAKDKIYVSLFGEDPDEHFRLNDEAISKNRDELIQATSKRAPEKAPQQGSSSSVVAPPITVTKVASEAKTLHERGDESSKLLVGDESAGLTKSAKRRLKEKKKLLKEGGADDDDLDASSTGGVDS